jgi:heptosyltransferase-2
MMSPPNSKPRILVIRGGAIGDFILTLPAIRLLREAFPKAHLEIIGYRHIVALAEGRYYADRTRSIEYGPMAGFFARNGTLDEELCEYFADFQQVISYLFDPDGLFEANLRRVGVKHFLAAHAKPDDGVHAARQLARPLESLALYLDDPAARVFPNERDEAAAKRWLAGAAEKPIAIHPGSGSPRKNWPVDRWRESIVRLLASSRRVIVVGGEADRTALSSLESFFGERIQIVRDCPLPELAALLARCAAFIGHDSGISHLAAAVGTRCVLLFGPTDPVVWAPANRDVRVIQAPNDDLAELSVEAVMAVV